MYVVYSNIYMYVDTREIFFVKHRIMKEICMFVTVLPPLYHRVLF